MDVQQPNSMMEGDSDMEMDIFNAESPMDQDTNKNIVDIGSPEKDDDKNAVSQNAASKNDQSNNDNSYNNYARDYFEGGDQDVHVLSFE